jgi:hypothetical protein
MRSIKASIGRLAALLEKSMLGPTSGIKIFASTDRCLDCDSTGKTSIEGFRLSTKYREGIETSECMQMQGKDLHQLIKSG